MKHLKKVVLLMVVLSLALVGSVTVLGQDDPDPIESVCLITDVGRVNDGTFNEYAYNGMLDAVDEFDLDSDFIETESETDYESNINTCVDEGFEAIVTVGFLIQDATVDAARANPDIFFIGIDQDISGLEDAPENFVGVQFREDQAGFLAGVVAALWANENEEEVIAGVYGIDVPAVKRFRNGYEQGALYVNSDWERGTNILGNYESSFVDPTVGISAANQYIGEGAFVIFGAGGPMGSAGIQEAASQGVWVIGVDQDEYFTTFGEGSTEGAEFLMTSAIKRVDQGVFQMLEALAEGEFEAFPGGGNIVFDAEIDGIGLAPKQEADVPDEIYEEADAVREMLISGDLSTGVDPVSGDLMEEAQNIVDTAVAADDFNVLVAAVQEAGLAETLSGGEFTVFAPTDEAFGALLEELDVTQEDLLARDDLADILTYHVVEGTVTSDMLEAGEVTTVNGATVTINLDDGVMVNDATVVTADIEASNGVIHVIDSVLLPPADEE